MPVKWSRQWYLEVCRVGGHSGLGQYSGPSTWDFAEAHCIYM